MEFDLRPVTGRHRTLAFACFLALWLLFMFLELRLSQWGEDHGSHVSGTVTVRQLGASAVLRLRDASGIHSIESDFHA